MKYLKYPVFSLEVHLEDRASQQSWGEFCCILPVQGWLRVLHELKEYKLYRCWAGKANEHWSDVSLKIRPFCVVAVRILKGRFASCHNLRVDCSTDRSSKIDTAQTCARRFGVGSVAWLRERAIAAEMLPKLCRALLNEPFVWIIGNRPWLSNKDGEVCEPKLGQSLVEKVFLPGVTFRCHAFWKPFIKYV